MENLKDPKLTPNSLTVLQHRYLKKDAAGKPAESPKEMFWRVARDIAAADAIYDPKADTDALARRFYQAMAGLEFLPNSPTLMNAGRELQQLSACFVLPVDDSLESIFEAIKQTALIHKSGGGTGFSFSRLRPKNDVVKTTHGISSGPVSFMTVFDSTTETIKQGGTRRGANMGILRVDHPDIEEFITAKRDHHLLTNFNLSVALTEEFMKAVEEDKEYSLINPRNGEVVQTRRAKEIFDLIVRSAWESGEPGIIFLDRINRDNPTPSLGEIESTNPCVTADTFVMTADGPRQVADLLGRSTSLVVNGRSHRSTGRGFFSTGTKEVFRLVTREGYSLRLTGDHPVMRAASVSRERVATEWIAAADLAPGDRIVLHDHRSLASWNGMGTESEGYLIGLLVGDGTLKKDKAVLSSWSLPAAVNGTTGDDGSEAVRQAAMRHALTLPHRSDFAGWTPIRGRFVHRMSLGRVRGLALELGMRPGSKEITPTLEKCSREFYRGFLRGLFDADGSVQGTQEKGVSVRLAQSDYSLLQAVQRMLLRLGIASAICRNRRQAGTTELPDGRGGTALYPTKAQHELIISGENIARFSEIVGFEDSVKRGRLTTLLASYKRTYNRERFLAVVDTVERDGVEEVFDVQVPGVNSFDANGLYVHNCGEQPLLPYESCNLGSINLARMVMKTDHGMAVDYTRLRKMVHLAVHFLDNVIDRNHFPVPEITEMTRATRKIGLGVMGYADLLFILGIPYDSEEALKIGEEVMGFINSESKEASRKLAAERGSFPTFESSVYAQRGEPFLRNATTTTIAPTGTISIIAGTSSGIEPVFSLTFTRHVLDGEKLTEVNPVFLAAAETGGIASPELFDEIAKKGSIAHLDDLPKDTRRIFKTALDILPEWHIRHQAAFQKHTDNAVSKTVNFPADATPNDIREAYLLAYRLGCKGVTVYRDKSRKTQVLSIELAPEGEADVERHPGESLKPRPRPEVISGLTRKIKTGCGNLYITVNEDEKGLFEVFTQIGKAGGCASSQAEAVSRLISLSLRAGIDPWAVVRQLKGVRCPAPSWEQGGMILSCADGIAKALEKYLEGNGHQSSSELEETIMTVFGACQECGGVLEHEGGCEVCRSCGFSRCS